MNTEFRVELCLPDRLAVQEASGVLNVRMTRASLVLLPSQCSGSCDSGQSP